jgi:nicotinamidase-related amidase
MLMREVKRDRAPFSAEKRHLRANVTLHLSKWYSQRAVAWGARLSLCISRNMFFQKGRDMTETTALIIIDMQKGMRNSSLPPRNNPQAEDNMARLRAAWRESGNPVVSVRHVSRSPESVFAPGQAGIEFQERFQPLPYEHVVEKNVPDAFINTGLERWLHVRDIRRLAIVGVSTNNSVEASARTAGNLGFSTVVVSDATFTFEQADFAGTLRSAEDVHLMALANIQADYADVRSTEDVLRDFNR